jgi:hypothetical protein
MFVRDIDRQEKNRSRFVAEAVRQELERRRRAELRKSLQARHPETAFRRTRKPRNQQGRLARGVVVMVDLDPAIGHEPRGTRP